MPNIPLQNPKPYNLEERTFLFAQQCRLFVLTLSKTTANIEDGKQLIRSSGSVAANYIEANESISKKDFSLRIKIARKEAKESRLWLRLSYTDDKIGLANKKLELMNEATELGKIFGAILEKTK